MKSGHKNGFALSILFGVYSCFPVAAVSAAGPLTIADAQSEYGSGQYRTCLQKISQLLTGDTVKSGSPQRYDLFMMRGECLLQLNQAALAAEAFEAAARVVKAEGDIKRFCAARSNAILIRASQMLRYQPTKGESNSIVPADIRRKAITLLFNDKFAQVVPQARNLKRDASWQELIKHLPDLADLYALETAGDPRDVALTLPLAQEIAGRTRAQMDESLDRIEARTDALLADASTPADNADPKVDVMKARGTTAQEREELRQMQTDLDAIQSAAARCRRINKRLGGNGQAWDAILGRCAEGLTHVKEAGFGTSP